MSRIEERVRAERGIARNIKDKTILKVEINMGDMVLTFDDKSVLRVVAYAASPYYNTIEYSDADKTIIARGN